MTTSDVSPYLLRPVRKLEEAIAESEQQRSESSTAQGRIVAEAEERSKTTDAPTSAAAEKAPTS